MFIFLMDLGDKKHYCLRNALTRSDLKFFKSIAFIFTTFISIL